MRRLLAPVLVMAAAWIADWRLALHGHTQLVQWTGRGIAALVFLLAWRFGRGRIAYAVVMLAAAGESLRYWTAGTPEQTALAVLLPVNLAVLAWTGDFRVWSVAGAWRWGVLAAQAVAVAAFARRAPLEATLVEAVPAVGLPQTVLASLLVAFLALGVRWRFRPEPIEAGLLVALGAASAGTAYAGTAYAATTYYLAAGMLVLGVALVESTFALAFEDGLTGLPARRALEEALRHLGRTYAVAMVDLDHFKSFNDRHGHEVGDQVLQMVAAQLRGVKGGGRAYRYGGEEFSVVFAGQGARDAEPYLEELRRRIAEADFTVRSPARPKEKPKTAKMSKTLLSRSGGIKKLKVTVSIGVAERSEKNSDPELVMKAADKALYRSKKAGRNRVTVGR